MVDDPKITLHDYLKHITMLSTGSLVLIATFLEKIFADPKGKCCVAISLIAFALSVLFALLAQTMLLHFESRSTDAPQNWADTVGGFAMIGVWLTFGIGIISFLIFVLMNL